MIGGIKIWREPCGWWTVALYNSAECDSMRIGYPEGDDETRIREWLVKHHPTAEYDRSSGLIQFMDGEDRGAESAALFKLNPPITLAG